MEIHYECPMLNRMPLSHLADASNAAVKILARDGARGLSMAALASELRMTAPGVRNWFGDVAGMRARVVKELAKRWRYWLLNDWRVPEDPAAPHRGMGRLLPIHTREIASVRVWLACVQLGVDYEEVGHVLSRHHGDEAAAVERRAADEGLALDEAEIQLVLATVRGLRLAVCLPGESMPVEEAHQQLQALLCLLRPERSTMAS